ncbi:hypothetical protein FQN54_007598 [Arachnomyces sp. PD_36]|nr:hypothetical protein FQN54_007598 [Arachnomyces sp. PD_36]
MNPGDETIGPGPKVEKNGLYMLLWDTDIKDKYHWGLFVAQTEISGILFHQTNGPDWKFVIEPENTTLSENLLAGLKLGVLEGSTEDWILSVKECVRGVSVDEGEEFTCRTWALAAVYELGDCGFIGMMPDWGKVRFIEEEANRLARTALGMRVQMVVPSEMSAP